VLGKFFGAFSFLSIITALSAYMPALIFVNGRVSIEQILVGYLGLFSLGAATIAVGTFASAIARNQLLAAVIAACLMVFLLLGWLLGQVIEAPLSGIFSYTAIFDRHFQPFMKGRLNTEGLVYYASVCFGFLMLATRSLQLRRLS
jgi:ABC-2 type transport system permease protein